MTSASSRLREDASGVAKRCSACRAWWPAKSFSRGKDVGGLSCYCKTCDNGRRASKGSGGPMPNELEADDSFEIPVVQRIVSAADAPPLVVAPLAHGWIPDLGGVRLQSTRGDVAPVPETSTWAHPLDWRAPVEVAADHVPEAAAPAHAAVASRSCRPKRSKCSRKGRELLAFFDRVLKHGEASSK